MNEIEQQIEELTGQLQELRSRQMQMDSQIQQIERKLKNIHAAINGFSGDARATAGAEGFAIVDTAKEIPVSIQSKNYSPPRKTLKQKRRFQVNQEMEDFIGTNLISKAGILVTIIGVFIGAKYAIDKELVNPLVRVIAGYLSGAVLIFIACRLKNNYEYFSSVLIGGGLAVTYFITYIAYSFYGLFPLFIAFVLMVITTAVAVGIALWYNQKVIALLGQVAAYFIPFLLGDGRGNIFVLFSYISVINVGLLILSFRKEWKLLYHIAFFLTWLIYLLSILTTGKVTGSFGAALAFITINFCTFYITFLAYKIFRKELYQVGEIAILLLNALVFFFLGTYLIDAEFTNIHILTWFTIANAFVHFAAGYLIYRLRLLDNSVFQFILGLGLLFVTIAIPIELNGNWVTILWAIEATVLFYVAKNTKRELYLEIALPLLIISFISLLHDWFQSYPFIRNEMVSGKSLHKTAFLNINFNLSLLVCVCLGYISFSSKTFTESARTFTIDFFSIMLPVVFLAVLYFSLFNEIHFYWDIQITAYGNNVNIHYQSITLIIYSFLYVAAWLFANRKYIKNASIHHLLLGAALLPMAFFLFDGLYTVGSLRDKYIAYPSGSSSFMLLARYFTFTALAILWVNIGISLKVFKPSELLKKSIPIVFNITLLSVISNEFIHWMDLAGYKNQYKLGLSLICGAYALVLLFFGMVRMKKHLRISAIVLFTATLLKLFFYDIASLSTISKTIVLVLLGILLLLASFLYNKYKAFLFDKEDAAT